MNEPPAPSIPLARLNVDTPFKLNSHAERILADALAGEQWLQALELTPIVTGLAGSDMAEFRRGCRRLQQLFKEVRDAGALEAARAVEVKMRLASQHEYERGWNHGRTESRSLRDMAYGFGGFVVGALFVYAAVVLIGLI